MQGFPKHIATRQDYINLLNMKEYREEALERLDELMNFDDRTVTRAIEPENPDNPESEWITEEIVNPHPIHAQRGFKEWMDIVELKAQEEGVKISEVLNRYSEEEIKASVVEVT
jgi:hypothetical protein